MYLFLSSEIGDIDNKEFRHIYNIIKEKLSFITDETKEGILLKDNTYGTEFESIAIIPMIISPRFDFYKERKLIRFKEKWADIRLRINYESYQSSDFEGKFKLVAQIIIESVRVIDARKKKDFQGQKLIDDILQHLTLSRL